MVVAGVELIQKSVVGSKNIACATKNTTSCGCYVMGPMIVSST